MVGATRWLGVAAVVLAWGSTVRGADTYAVDGVHSSVSFMIKLNDISYIHGRFNEFSGEFVIADDPAKTSFALSIKVESIDTNNQKRDEHLRAPDYFNVKQFPNLTFKSTSVKPIKGGFDVTGDLTMHGVTKPVSFTLKGGDKVVEGQGKKKIGVTTALSIKRSEFGVTTALDALGDEVQILISVQAAK